MIIRKKNIPNKKSTSSNSAKVVQKGSVIKKEDIILDVEKAKNSNEANQAPVLKNIESKAEVKADEFDDFEKSLDINLYLLSQGNIQSYMFERIGKIYYHLGLDKEALDYLIVARSLMSKENKQCGFNSLIKELKLKGDKNEKKRKRIM